MERAPTAALLALLAASVPLAARAQPRGTTTTAPAAVQADATDFQLTPKNGQDEEQQWFDRYECDSWAKWQSRYDPFNTQGGPPQQALSEDYRRLMSACLQAHGYAVRYWPPEPTRSAAPPYDERSDRRATPRELRYRPFSVQAGGGYTVAAASTRDYVQNGANAGAALTWFPSAASPLGVRVAGSYTWFKPASAPPTPDGMGYNRGEVDVYGADVDLRLNLSHLPSRQRLYLLGGIGRYRIDTLLQEVSEIRTCGLNFCGVISTLIAQEHNQSAWESSWNAGLGWEIALDSHIAFFVEARYQYVHNSANSLHLVPISLGLRF